MNSGGYMTVRYLEIRAQYKYGFDCLYIHSLFLVGSRTSTYEVL